jgi:hypothetical protein
VVIDVAQKHNELPAVAARLRKVEEHLDRQGDRVLTHDRELALLLASQTVLLGLIDSLRRDVAELRDRLDDPEGGDS